MPDTILFYLSAWRGAQPFVRVPATPEGLRYAGYMFRYKMGKPTQEYIVSATSALTVDEYTSFTEGVYGYPTNPGIPLGTERFIFDPMGWSRWDGERWLVCDAPPPRP